MVLPFSVEVTEPLPFNVPPLAFNVMSLFAVMEVLLVKVPLVVTVTGPAALRTLFWKLPLETEAVNDPPVELMVP